MYDYVQGIRVDIVNIGKNGPLSVKVSMVTDIFALCLNICMTRRTYIDNGKLQIAYAN